VELQANAENIISALRVVAINSPFPCFAGRDPAAIIERLRTRLRTDLDIKSTVDHCLELIIQSHNHMGTRNYDSFQYYTNGILP